MHAPDTFRRQLLDAVPRLRRYARTLTFDGAAADDLVQSTLERALVHWRRFDPLRDMAVWLLAIAHNAWLDERRRNARLDVVPPEAFEQLAASGGGESEHMLRLDLLAALRRLGEDQRAVLLLIGVEQLTYAEASEILAIPVGTVMSRLSRARSALRQQLERPAAAQLKRVI
jgi:RNA polymerase sigma-70 factor (ECF subfamily)